MKPSGTAAADTYDAGNHLLKFTDSVNGAISRSYDDLGHLTGESSPQGTVPYSVAANCLSMTATNSVGFGYKAVNRRTALTLPNGITANYSYGKGCPVSALWASAKVRGASAKVKDCRQAARCVFA
jgi:YD repeat-containing protein